MSERPDLENYEFYDPQDMQKYAYHVEKYIDGLETESVEELIEALEKIAGISDPYTADIAASALILFREKSSG